MTPTRTQWLHELIRCAGPLYAAMSEGVLHKSLPSHDHPSAPKRACFMHLEALGRSLAGIAPWLELEGGDDMESSARSGMLHHVRKALAHAVDPESPDQIDFSAGSQCLVDAAFLALGLLRGWTRVWLPLPADVKERLVRNLLTTRTVTPFYNNWLLFSAMVEAFLFKAGEDADKMRIDCSLRQHEQWYKGDGAYGDGPAFHWDYYNSFVIQPFLLEICGVLKEEPGIWQTLREPFLARARRYAVVQERMIAPDGTFPPLGRSLTYRFGAFHHLAAMTLAGELSPELSPAGVRCALTAVLQRLLCAPGVYDQNGWLRIGFAGYQPGLAESYISTGSLYLTCCGFLPLGLPASDPFWSAPDEAWTAKKIWSGVDLPADHSIHL